MNIEIGQTVILKKQHPCGGRTWEVVRVGADVKIKCLTCGHIVMLDREQFRKSVREVCEQN